MLLNQLFIRVNYLYRNKSLFQCYTTLPVFSHVHTRTYNRRHNIDNQISACAYALNQIFIRVIL
jgi:hypothetical protein